MKLSSLCCTCLIILCACGSARAGDLTSAEIAARDYSFQGVTIGTTKEDFVKRFPNAKSQVSERAHVTGMYAALKGREQYLLVEFYQGKVYYMGLTFSPVMLTRIGGRSVLESKITDTLGFPNSVKGNMSYWEFPKVHRKVGYRQSIDGSSTLLVIDTAVDKRRREAQTRDLDIGF